MEEIKGVIFDIDGVLEYQGIVYPSAVETVMALREMGIILRFLTNSTLKSRESCTAKLRRSGFQVYPEEVITASYATAEYLRGLNPKSCWVMLECDGLDEFKEFHQDLEYPQVIVIGDNRSKFDFEHLNRALRLLRRGAGLIGMQSELVDSSLGQLELNVGSWVGMLERASGVRATYIGKPNPFAFELALRSMGLDRRQVIVVGDRVAADIQGASGLGIRSVLLRTGEFKESDLESPVRPDFILDTVGDILSLF